jgi:hypothetical protein
VKFCMRLAEGVKGFNAGIFTGRCRGSALICKLEIILLNGRGVLMIACSANLGQIES